ncbi:MAG: hypothetical protein IK055_05940, partial [Lachnospiraceae bacterium]|nr:hypothetical protein [Lachnospiraceae bacterium]
MNATNCCALRAPAIRRTFAISRCFASLLAHVRAHSKKDSERNELLRASRSRNSTHIRNLALLRIASCSCSCSLKKDIERNELLRASRS